MLTVGIDLGTTATVISVMKNGIPQTVPVDNGRKTTPSVVSYSRIDSDDVAVGRKALSNMDYARTIFSIKRNMGSRDNFFGKFPEEISAEILSYVKKITEQKLEDSIESAVITVPAHFSDIQRTATKRAASLAGIKVLRLINEPTAAAIAFGLGEKTNGVYAVYDFGGGTFDFSILRLIDGIFQVLATGGDNYLGGDDIDNDILEYNLKHCGIVRITESERLRAKLVAKAMKEQCNFEKSTEKECVIGEKTYLFKLSPALLRDLSEKYIERSFKIADQVFLDAKLSHNQIDGILMVGGMTKMQIVKDSAKNHFKTRIFDNIDPEEVVAFGAAIQADSIVNKNRNTLLIDVVPLTLGIETFGGGVDKIIHRNTPIPTVQTREYTTYSDNQTGIKFHVVQGERALAKDCRSIAKFELKGIPPAVRGTPKVEVRFSVDVNGLLNVSACEKNTGIEQNIVVEPSAGLTEDEMISMLENALKNAAQDKERSAYISAKMSAERQISFWESIINEIPEPEQNRVANGIMQLKEYISNDGSESKNILNTINNIDDIVGHFLDDIISKRLSKNPIKIDEVKR